MNWFCPDPRPWKLPSPFVAIMFRAFFGLIMLASLNATYDQLEILSSSSDVIYATNIAMTCLLLAMIAMFCEQRWRNNYFSSGVKAFCFNFALLWGVVFASNIGLIVSSFIICHVPKYQDEAEARYCRFFGNRTIAEFPEWQRAGWIMYHWTVVAIALSIACWQMMSWFCWYLMIKDLLNRRASTANAEGDTTANAA